MEKAEVYLVPSIDTDPRVYHKYVRGKEIIDNDLTLTHEKWSVKKAIKIATQVMKGKCVFMIHTSPFFRSKFIRVPFMNLWEEVLAIGGELALHPQEDKVGGGTYYYDKRHMERVINEITMKIRNLNLPLNIFRSGYYAWSPYIAPILRKLNYKIDLSCAPGIVDPNRDVNWINAPRYAYYNNEQNKNQNNCKTSFFVIPLGWDGKGHRFEENYLFCEKGSLNSLCRVWDTLVEEKISSFPKIVSFLYHASTIDDESICNRIARFIEYVRKHNGVILTASEAKELYDKKTIKLANSSY